MPLTFITRNDEVKIQGKYKKDQNPPSTRHNNPNAHLSANFNLLALKNQQR